MFGTSVSSSVVSSSGNFEAFFLLRFGFGNRAGATFGTGVTVALMLQGCRKNVELV